MFIKGIPSNVLSGDQLGRVEAGGSRTMLTSSLVSNDMPSYPCHVFIRDLR